MTIFKSVFWATVYSLITINGLIMSAQYFLGINNIVGKVLGIFEEVNFAAIL